MLLSSESITIALDRFINASTGEDALKSLQQILLLSQGQEDDTVVAVPSLKEIVQDEPDFLEHLLHVLQLHELKNSGTLGSTTTTLLPPELWTTALSLFQHWWSTSTSHDDHEQRVVLLQHPQPGRVLETWLDVATSSGSGSGSGGALPLYIRVQAWQFLGDLLVFQQQPKSSSTNSTSTTIRTMVVEQWLQAPNGIHRLVQALAPPPNATTATNANYDPSEEAVWMQALVVAQGLAQTSPAICKILIFSEVELLLLQTIWHVYGGLTLGNPYVLDALRLIHTCLGQISNETSLLQLIWEERPMVAQRLTHLLDLRGGHAFLHPDEYNSSSSIGIANKKTKNKTKAKNTTTSKVGPLSRHKNRNNVVDDDEDDDLDALLQVATKTTKASDSSSTTTTTTTSSQVDEDHNWPHLLESEEAVVTLVLKILSVMMMSMDDEEEPDKKSFRERIWTQYAPNLTSFVWELGLVVPFPPGSKAFFALVSSQLQRQALELMATHFHSVEVMTRMNGLDRLLEVVCTGGGMAQDLHDRLACSQAALTVLRNTLTATQIHPLLLHTLAPPPTPEGPDEGNEDDTATGTTTAKKDIPPPPTVVQKLWNTVAEHLNPQSKATTTIKNETNDRTLFVSGALGALSLFCIDVESREMMVQSTPPAATLEDMLEFLSLAAAATTSNDNNDQIRIYAVFRFLLQYIHATPSLVQSLLSTPASIHLATLASTTNNNADDDMVAPLTLLLLGLSLEYFPKTQQECGGWTRASLLQVFQGSSWTIPKATKAMQGFLDTKGIQLGFGCELEVKYWKDWYRTAVMTVRKRLVLEMAGSGGSMEDGNYDEATAEDASLTTQKIKPLQAMIAQQSAEMEELRTKLHQANAKLSSQDHQLETWTRRTQSNPTQLDAMLNELTATTASLQEEIVLLQSKAKQQDDQHEAQLGLLQQELLDQRDETTKFRTQAEQTQEDRDRMEQELAALSQAYANLEDEYRRSTTDSTASSATASGPTGGSTEVATLRAENERLKASSKEADEWMSQAYGKLSELGTQNQTLEQQVKALQDQLTNTAIQQEQGQREEIQRLQEHLAASQAEVATLQEQATTSHEQWTQAYNGLEQTKLALEQEIQALSSRKDDANTARIQELEAMIESQNQKVDGLQTALEEAQQGVVSPPPVDEPGHAQMMQQLDAAREELQSVRSRLEEELYKKELVIREMESRLSSGLGSYTVKDIQERDNEIEELRAANEAAQDWMGKAVEQHRSLQQKLVAATTEGMRSSSAGSIVDTSELDALKKAISVEKVSHEETRQQVDSLRQALEDAYQERQSMARDLSNAADQSREQSSKFENHIADLKSQMSQQEARANATIAQWQESHTEELTRCRELRQEVEGLKEQVSAFTATNKGGTPAEVVEKSVPTSAADFFGAGESSPLPLAPAPSTAELTEELRKIEVELHEAKSALQGDDDVIRQWQERVTDLEAEVERLNIQAKEQEDEGNEAISKWQDAHAALERDLSLAVDGDQTAKYQDEIHRLNERVQELEAELAGASSGEEQTAKLLSEIEQLKETQNAMELEAREAIARWEEEYNTLVKERDDLLESHEKTETASISSVIVDRVEELQAEIERLTAQDEDATEAIAQWQEAHASLEAELERVNGQLDERTNELEETKINLEQGTGTMTTGSEWESRAKELKTEVNRLLEQNAKLETELEEAKSVVLESPNSLAEIQSIRESRDESEQRCAALSRELEKILEQKTTLETKALENTQIQSDLEAARKEIADIQAKSQNIIQQWSDRVVELEQQLTDLQSNMSTQEKEASCVISSWETQCTELQDQLANVQGQLEARNEDQGSDELRQELETLQAESSSVIQQWHDRVNELETQMSDMQLTLEQQEAEASQAIAAWETKVSELQLEISELEIQITEPREENGELRGELEATREELDSVRESASAAEAKWRDRVDELEGQLANMRVTVQQQQGDASQAIGKLARLEDQVETLQTELATNSQKVEAMNELEASLEALQQESSAVVAQWSERVAELEGQVAELESSLEQQETEASEVIVSWEQKVSELDEELVDMESKMATTQRDSAATIQKLEAELQAARENYESSKVTSERLSIEKDRLEQELDNLKENRDELQADLQVSTVGQLRQALYRSIDELQKSRHSERLASEQLAKLRLEMAVSEQEIISAKAEIRFLSDALEDLRIKEAKKRENLEYHIGSFLQEVNHEVTLHREEQNQHDNDGSSSGNPLIGDDDASEDTMALDGHPSSGVASAAE